jgi:hypothetical protein
MKKFQYSLILLLSTLFSYSQNIGIGTTSPHASAALEIKDSTKGILIPRMTMVQRNAIANPAEGLMVYQTDSTKGFWYWDGIIWKSFNSVVKETPLNVFPSNNFTLASGINSPSFLKYFGNCSQGNHVCVNNETILNNSQYCNLTIPVGITARINPESTTVIYVSDTLFLYGKISGNGANGISNSMNATTNHIGATSSGYEVESGCYYSVVGSQNLSFSWNVTQQPSSYNQSFGGIITKNVGSSNCWAPNQCNSTNGSDVFISDLLKVMHFGLDISGANGISLTSTNNGCGAGTFTGGGQGGGGLYIIAKNLVFN